MKYVIGVDLGTSSVKVLLVDQNGTVCQEVTKSYPLIQPVSGYSEQDPEEWVLQTKEALKDIVNHFDGDIRDIAGISFSGQMHGLVLLDQQKRVLRNAILWNDTRTTEQCQQIYEEVGKEKLYQLVKNPALEGFTLPKILWVKQHEPHLFEKANVFLLPKDYLRYRMTNQIHSEYSDAAGTLLLNVKSGTWSTEMCEQFDFDISLCPPLVESHEFVGCLNKEFSQVTGLSEETKVFAGGADNACGAIGAGIISNGETLCSIGTSGVVLSFEEGSKKEYGGNVHFFNHALEDSFYVMGVTLSAGNSLNWFKDNFASDRRFDELVEDAKNVPIGANGLVFTPYLAGERTPYADSTIRGSFIGIDTTHKQADFTRAVLEGVTFSLNETINILRESGKVINSIVSIGGGAKSGLWLQIQADIFNSKIVKLKSEQGPGMGAAMLAAYGCGWFDTMKDCVSTFVTLENIYEPVPEHVQQYQELFEIYKEVYMSTKSINEKLMSLRR